MKYILNTILETEEFGIRLGGLLERGDILCLNGDLGAGKTTLSKAIGKGLGVTDYITSPTFSIMNQYQGRLPMYHFDVYRLDDWEQLEDIGAEEYFYGDGVCLVEWAEKTEEYLPKGRLEIKLSMMGNENAREMVLEAMGKRYEDLLEELKK